MPIVNGPSTLDLAGDVRKSLLRTRRRVSRGLPNLKRRGQVLPERQPGPMAEDPTPEQVETV